jgi:hypothetical protein
VCQHQGRLMPEDDDASLTLLMALMLLMAC